MSTQTQRTAIGLTLTIFVILTIGILYLGLPNLPGGNPTPTENPPLDPVPPSGNPPTNSTTIETIQCGSLLLNTTGNISGVIPHNGPIEFHVELRLNVRNNGTEDINNFHAIKTSLYYASSGLFYTFSIHPDENYTIPAGETMTLTYHNQETSLDTEFSLTEYLYARVLISVDTDQECILTTPFLEGIFAIE